jgi:hypothetical protein
MIEAGRMRDSRSLGCKFGIPAWMLQDICCGWYFVRPNRNGKPFGCLRGLLLGIGLPVLSGCCGRVLLGRLLGNGIILGRGLHE